jgi:N-acetylglucosaminyl-diphospho-decaprenol L-rhamnosyltransferase
VDLSIVVVSWNVSGLLRRCLRSVEQSAGLSGLQYEIIVVDNASTDGSVAMVGAEYPQVQLVANEKNVGFPAANNQGLARASGRYVLLLNPDTEVIEDALGRLVGFAEVNADVGVAGPMLLNPDGSIQESRRRFPTVGAALFESTWLQPYAPRRLLNRYYVLDRPADEAQDVDWVSGAALLARRGAVERVGPMDEGFFMYSEELDWCRRFKDAGWRVSYVPEARIVHHGGRSSEQVSAERHIHFQRSKLRYFRKYHGSGVALALRLFLLASYVWQIALEGAKWLVGHKRAMRAERIGVYWHVLKTRLAQP